MMKEMLASIELIVKAVTASFFMIRKLSLTYRFQILGGTDDALRVDSSISSSIQRMANRIAQSTIMNLLVNFVIEDKIVT